MSLVIVNSIHSTLKKKQDHSHIHVKASKYYEMCVTEFNLDFHTSKSARCGTSEKYKVQTVDMLDVRSHLAADLQYCVGTVVG